MEKQARAPIGAAFAELFRGLDPETLRSHVDQTLESRQGELREAVERVAAAEQLTEADFSVRINAREDF